MALRYPAGVRDTALLQSMQTGFGAHPAYYSVGNWDSFSGRKATAQPHLHIVPKLRMRMAISHPPVFMAYTQPNLPSPLRHNHDNFSLTKIKVRAS